MESVKINDLTRNFNEVLPQLIAEHHVKNASELARRLSISPQSLTEIGKERQNATITILQRLCTEFPVNPRYLLFGEPELMFTETAPIEIVSDRLTSYNRKTKIRTLEDQQVPLYNFEAAAGLVKLFSTRQDIINYIQIPNMPQCDGAIYVSGDSMYPLLKSGDIVAYKQVSNIGTGIMFGEMYILSFTINGDELTAVKYIQKSEMGTEFVKLVSHNQHHQAKDIPLTCITALALVKVSIRMQSMA